MSRGALTNNYAGDCWLVRVEQIAGAVLFIGGVTGTIAPTTVPQSILGFDLPLLIAVSLGVMVLAWTGARISRIEGLALVAGYALYIAFTAGLI